MTRRAFLLLAGLAAAAALVPVAANLVVGGSLFEESLRREERPAAERPARERPASRPRAGVDCPIDRGPCLREVAGVSLELDVEPRPLRTMADLTFTVRAHRGAAPVEADEAVLTLAMPDMYMGENRVRLAAAGPGAWRGRGVIVRCPSGGRVWSAEVTLRQPAPGAGPVQGAFTFELAREGAR